MIPINLLPKDIWVSILSYVGDPTHARVCKVFRSAMEELSKQSYQTLKSASTSDVILKAFLRPEKEGVLFSRLISLLGQELVEHVFHLVKQNERFDREMGSSDFPKRIDRRATLLKEVVKIKNERSIFCHWFRRFFPLIEELTLENLFLKLIKTHRPWGLNFQTSENIQEFLKENRNRYSWVDTMDTGCDFLRFIPPLIFTPYLRTLSISTCMLADIPDEIYNLTRLTGLSVAYNCGPPLAVSSRLGELTNLCGLQLIGLKLTEIPPEISRLTNLESLELKKNKISRLPSMSSLRHLMFLDLHSLNEGESIQFPSDIFCITRLRRLYLRKNQITSLPHSIGNLTRLEELDLKKNLLTQVPIELISLKRMENLDLRGNPLESFPIQLIHLRELKLPFDPEGINSPLKKQKL